MLFESVIVLLLLKKKIFKEKLMMAEHAAECKSCRDDMDFMLSIIGVIKGLPEIKAPDDFLDRLNARIDLEESKRKRGENKLNFEICCYLNVWKRRKE